MIPVLICPILNRPDLARQMLASVDVPVGRVVIVDNTPGHDLDVGPAEYLRPLTNLGFGGSINAAISQTAGAPWWLFASNDLIFGRGDLEAIVAAVEGDGPRIVTGDRSDSRMLRLAYGALNAACVDAVGLFDEWAFFPAYFEDDDYERRCHLGGVEWITYNGTVVCGGGGPSQTIKGDPAMAAHNARTYPLNAAQYAEKWGGPPGSETLPTPYGLPVPLSFTRPDIAGRRSRAWT